MTSLKEQMIIMGAIYLAGFVLGFRSMIGGEVGLLAFTGGLITFFVLLFGVHEIGRQVERKREYMLGISAFLLIILTSCGMSSIVWDGVLEKVFQFFVSVMGNPVLLPFSWLLSSVWGDDAQLLQTLSINGIPCVFLFVAALSGVLRGSREGRRSEKCVDIHRKKISRRIG